jgi:hypothetical protein
MSVLPPAKGLVAGLAQVRTAGDVAPMKISIRTRDRVNLQYIEGQGRSWLLYGTPPVFGRRWRRKFATLRALDKYVRELRPEDVQIRRRAPRVVVTGKRSDAWRVDLSEFAEIATLIGEDVFAAFMRCFVGADRLKSLLHFYVTSEEKFGHVEAASERNFHVSWLLVVGTLHELGEALQGLNATKVHLKLPNRSRWKPLEKLRRQWYVHPVASRVRNQAGHHLGYLDVYKNGITALSKMSLDATLRMGHGARRHFSFARGACDILLLGLTAKTDKRPELEVAELRKLLKDAGVANRKLHDAIEEYFLQVLGHAGVGVTGHLTE